MVADGVITRSEALARLRGALLLWALAVGKAEAPRCRVFPSLMLQLTIVLVFFSDGQRRLCAAHLDWVLPSVARTFSRLVPLAILRALLAGFCLARATSGW